MVLISTENLERMQQQYQQQQRQENHQPEISNIENVNNNSVRTQGTPLSRLDAEMYRILNLTTPSDEGERWKMYREVLQRYLHFVREAKKRLRKDSREALSNIDDPDQEMDAEDDDFDEFSHTLITSEREGSATTSSSSSFGEKHSQSAEMIKKIIETVSKSYRYKAHTLLKYLLDTPSSKISWDSQGVVTMNGTVVKDSNISELINDAIRERKTVKAIGRIQFARLLRDINAPSALIGNRSFLHESKLARRNKSSELTPVTSTPKTRRLRSRLNETVASEGDSVFVSADEDEDDKTIVSDDANPASKRGLFGWSRLS